MICRVCLQYNGVATLTIAGVLLISAVPNEGFDSTLSCVDTNLPIGWQPIHVDYAGIPEAKISVLQLFILPVSVVSTNLIPMSQDLGFLAQLVADRCGY